MPQITLAYLLKLSTILISVFGAILGLVKWFYPGFYFGSFTVGWIIIFLNGVLFFSEVRPFDWFVFIQFSNEAWGKAALFGVIGMLLAHTKGVFIAGWVIFWVWGLLYVVAQVLNLVLEPPIVQVAPGSGFAGAGGQGLINNPNTTSGSATEIATGQPIPQGDYVAIE